jgi:GAF domain-containing protein
MRGADIVGVLVIRRRTPGLFTPSAVDLIKTFAAQSALAVQNARLFATVFSSTHARGGENPLRCSSASEQQADGPGGDGSLNLA